MFKLLSSIIICLILYGLLMVPFVNYLHNKPCTEKLGYIPSVTALKAVASDHKELLAASLVLKVIMYFGSLVDTTGKQIDVAPDYMAMSRLLHGAVKLDPYNMDAYYFAQSFLTWDVKQYKLANELLINGMKYRTWDWYLPFFVGFNSAYFMHDYAAAATYYQRAGELSGADLSKLLAGRYMQESGQTELAIIYLDAMQKSENNPALKNKYNLRLTAFREARKIEIACEKFSKSIGAKPMSLEQLVVGGFLTSVPKDPYGGQFYLEVDGKVATTSKYAFAGADKQRTNKVGDRDERH
jgi:tetratricopeptide (TPR) repeat protein